MTSPPTITIAIGPSISRPAAPLPIAAGRSLGLSERSVYRYLRRTTASGTVKNGGGLYWAAAGTAL